MTDTDGNIGTVTNSTVEKVCGLLFDISGQSNFWTAGAGLAVAENLKDTVVEINSLDDAVKLGITAYTGEEEEDVSKDLLAGIPYYHIKQFFDMAGGTGRLFIAFADCSSGWTALIDMQRAAGGIISQFGVWTEQNLWKNMDSSSGTYSVNLITDLQNIGEQLANDYFAPASILLSANTSRVTTSSKPEIQIVFSKIPSCILDARYVTVLLGQSIDTEVKKMQGSLTSTTPVGVVGLALGALSKANVGESIGWVQNYDLSGYISGIEFGFGDATISDGAITNATVYSSLSRSQLDGLDDKGYVFLCTYAGLEGHVYFSSDRTCSDGDYNTIARNRTINKSRRGVRNALLPYVNAPMQVNPSTGMLSSAQQTVITNAVTNVLNAMATAEEISSVGTVSISSDQSILKTQRIDLSYTIIPLGCSKEIYVTEGLSITQ